ncbi:MAG: SLBB domain-containing protein [Candidatus Neomarinimicrobiota bacterium]
MQQELASQGINIDEVIAQAQQLGIDLFNPERAVLQARRLGVPEQDIQKMLEVASRIKTGQLPGDPLLEPLQVETPGEGTGLAYPRIGVEPTMEVSDSLLEGVDTLVAESPYFGYDFFQGIPEAFELSAIGPVDEAYYIGYGDELRLTVWGAAEFQYDLQIDREGRVYLPNVGQYTAAGKPLGRLRRDLKKWLARTYSGLATSPPTIFMDLTLTRLRPIRVFVLGEVARPGGYTIPNSSTVFNALYHVGGPLTRGTLRGLQVIRNGEPIATVDFYNYLLKGYDPNQVRLTENDHIFIPLRGKTVQVSGEVRRPAIYEVKESETLTDLLDYTGGLTPNGYTKRLQIERIISFPDRDDPSIAREVIDIDLEPILQGQQTATLVDGDVVNVFSILDVFTNAVTVSGAVIQPGIYELGKEIVLLSDLIRAADGLAGDAYLGKGDLVRTEVDSTEVLISIDIDKVLQNAPEHNLTLQARDHVIIYSLVDLRIEEFVTIKGAVKFPGDYPLQQNLTVEDLIFKAGGFVEDAYSKSAQLSRLISDTIEGNERVEIIELSLLGNESSGGLYAYGEQDDARRLHLKHRDILYVRSDPGFIPQQHVEIEGEVLFPGTYALQKENETLADLVRRAGGILATGYAQGGRLIREGERVVVSFDEIFSGSTRADVILLNGDKIFFPRKPNTVAVRGNVGIEGLIKFDRGKRVGYYLDQAGGRQKDTKEVLLTQANGATFKLSKRLLFFRENPVVDEGATIMVIPKELTATEKLDLRGILADSLAFVTSVLTVLVLTQRL